MTSESSRPRVLVIDEEVPIPSNTGKRLRTFNLLKRLGEEFEIELLVHANGADQEALRELGRSRISVNVSGSAIPAKTGLGFPVRLLSNLLFSKLPYSVASHYRRGYRELLEHLFAVSHFDLVHCEWTPYATYLRDCPLPVVVSAHNLEAQIWRRLADSAGNPLTRLFLSLQARRMEAFESQVFAWAPHVTAVSEPDAREIRARGGKSVEVVDNGVDTEYFTPAPLGSGEEGTLVFTGSMDWRPNQDAVRWFIDKIHPLLMERRDYRLFVVGRNPPDWLRRSDSIPPQIKVTGTVDDVRPYIRRARAYVVPLRVGGGSRLKILEAMAMSRAVISTGVGAEGLDIEPGVHFRLADDPQTFAWEILSLLADENQRRELGAAGRRQMEEHYDWGAIARLQGNLWRRAIAESRGARGLGATEPSADPA